MCLILSKRGSTKLQWSQGEAVDGKSIFIYLAQNPNHIASIDFTICTVNDILCP